MNKKKIIALIMSITLAFSIVGCGENDDGESTLTENTTKEGTFSNSKDELNKIEITQENVFKLGDKQTKEIKTIIEKYGVKTTELYSEDKNSAVIFSEDINETGFDDTKGYSIQSNGNITVNDGGNHNYGMVYGACIKTDEHDSPFYSYDITINYPEEEFKLNNFKLFKELVKEVEGNYYDEDSLDTFIKEHFKKIQDGKIASKSAREIGPFREQIDGGDRRVGNNTMVTFSFSLRD